MVKTSVYLDKIHEKFFKDNCINVSAFLRKKIEEDSKFKEWSDNYARFPT